MLKTPWNKSATYEGQYKLNGKRFFRKHTGVKNYTCITEKMFEISRSNLNSVNSAWLKVHIRHEPNSGLTGLRVYPPSILLSFILNSTPIPPKFNCNPPLNGFNCISSILNRTIFGLYRIISVSNTKWDAAPRSIQYGCNQVVIELRHPVPI